MYLSIVIPCYNEEKRIGRTLRAIHAFMKTKPYSFEVIVVDNGSRDATRRVIEGHQGIFPNLRIISRQSHGKGWAVKQGMLAAEGEYRLFTDADNSTDITQLDKLLPYATHGADVVIGSRKAPGAVITEKQPFYRVWLGNIFALFVRIMVPLRGIKDTQNGFKLFTKQAAEKLFTHQSIYYWAFDVEILALAQIFGFTMKEVPIVWVNDERSKMNWRGMLRMGLEVILTRLHLLTFDFEKLKRVHHTGYHRARLARESA